MKIHHDAGSDVVEVKPETVAEVEPEVAAGDFLADAPIDAGTNQIDVAPPIDTQPDQAGADTLDVQPDATIDAPVDLPAEAQMETAPDLPVEMTPQCFPYLPGSGGVCPPGCHTDADCVSGYECSTNNVCIDRCRKSTADNEVANGGFDSSASDWTSGNGLPANWDPFTDASDCPRSGSLKIEGTGPVLSALIQIPSGLFHVGYWVKGYNASTGVAPCTINWCKTQACQVAGEIYGTDEMPSHGPVAGSDWQFGGGDFTITFTNYARITCSGTGVRFDHFYWSTTRGDF